MYLDPAYDPLVFPGGDSLLFLDVDGVLNCVETFERNDAVPDGAPDKVAFDEPDAGRLALLRCIVDVTAVRVVLSSTWRLKVESFDRIQAALRTVGVVVFGCTVEMEFESRNDEIADFIERYNQAHVRPARAWLALDDLPLFDMDRDLRRSTAKHRMRDVNVVRTTKEYGLTRELADEVIRKLGDQAAPPESEGGGASPAVD